MTLQEQLAWLDQLEEYISHKAQTKSSLLGADTYRSENLNDLVASLAQAQGEYPSITFNRIDSYFQEEYVDFNTIMSKIRPILSKYNLAVIQQQRIHDGGAIVLHTSLHHPSGQWIESRSRIIPLKEGVRVYGSELNFQKSQALIALLGITITNDPYDDNACAAMEPTRNASHKGTSISHNVNVASRDVVVKEQLEELEYELSEFPDIAKMILDQWHLSSLADMPKSKYLKAISKIREIKALRKGLIKD